MGRDKEVEIHVTNDSIVLKRHLTYGRRGRDWVTVTVHV